MNAKSQKKGSLKFIDTTLTIDTTDTSYQAFLSLAGELGCLRRDIVHSDRHSIGPKADMSAYNGITYIESPTFVETVLEAIRIKGTVEDWNTARGFIERLDVRRSRIPELAELLQKGKFSARNYDPIPDMLTEAGLDERIVDSDRGLFQGIIHISPIQLVTANSVYKVHIAGSDWVLKEHKDLNRAGIEAAGTYYLSSHLPFIQQGFAPVPLFINGTPLTLQKDISSDAGFHRSLHYWLRSFGQFHTLTASLLGQQGIVLPDMHLRTTTEEKERH
ncbi:MAG: hypothetical protein WC254_05035, partial [Candidatus Woesearchaeota archaeon]